ncbi:hypothetical protein C8A05DRAFT_12088 [Staphylotrichum tortipilum]|uniref:Indole-diterpene biosynthesis protein PaxU n=1 Tax=Staphylotrichum tortipilum TaxID=2831512 RepID=A0AAN6RX34_9PEZI|nr:hypothetical protein C8A05DRAFT_12088 [Staphylotrichum longicolle]
MTKLAPCVYIYRPSGATTTSTELAPSPTTDDAAASQKPIPKLIVLATWMGARDPHIAKYLVQYQLLFPTSPILLLRAEARHFLLPRGNARDFAPAVPFMRSIFPDLGSSISNVNSATENGTDEKQRQQPPPEMLIHAWSNGGVSSLHNLRLALSTNAAAAAASLPRYTIVLDSTPGAFRYRAAHLAFTTGLKGLARWLMAPLMHFFCAMYWLQHELLGRGRTGPLAGVRRVLNDAPSQVSEVRRAYVYGEGDKLVHWWDVERHAEDAEGRGFVVKREKFEGSEHVAHVRVDAERYWKVVRETWEGRE